MPAASHGAYGTVLVLRMQVKKASPQAALHDPSSTGRSRSWRQRQNAGFSIFFQAACSDLELSVSSGDASRLRLLSALLLLSCDFNSHCAGGKRRFNTAKQPTLKRYWSHCHIAHIFPTDSPNVHKAFPNVWEIEFQIFQRPPKNIPTPSQTFPNRISYHPNKTPN